MTGPIKFGVVDGNAYISFNLQYQLQASYQTLCMFMCKREDGKVKKQCGGENPQVIRENANNCRGSLPFTSFVDWKALT